VAVHCVMRAVLQVRLCTEAVHCGCALRLCTVAVHCVMRAVLQVRLCTVASVSAAEVVLPL